VGGGGGWRNVPAKLSCTSLKYRILGLEVRSHPEGGWQLELGTHMRLVSPAAGPLAQL
jgi:hypothetical protein